MLLVGIFISACTAGEPTPDIFIETDQPIADMANPAALYCEGLGYELVAVERDGGMDADCVFPDGSRCAQWDFFAGSCGKDKSFCESQGGKLQEGSITICLFSDGSTCEEYQYFSGECAPGDNPGEVIEEEEDLQEEAFEIKDMISARDFLVVYLSKQYGIEISDPWMEANITPADAAGVTTMRYVSGPLTIIISAEAAAPYPSLYNVQEVSYIANGFWWVGSITFDGFITEFEVVEPWSVLNEEQARDAALEYLFDSYNINSPTDWVDEGPSQTGDTLLGFRYSSGSWLVIVEFAPAAPLVARYKVVVENSTDGLRWEGEITGPGEITEISYNQ
jgi:putative hemolysin